jgi:hypothetical protein
MTTADEHQSDSEGRCRRDHMRWPCQFAIIHELQEERDLRAENERLLALIAGYRRAEEAVTEFSNRPPMADEDLLDDDLFAQWNAEHEQVWSTLMTAKAGLFAALGG